MSEKTTTESMTAAGKALACARLADDQKARDVRVLDLQGVCDFADFFVVATCGSSLQLRGLAGRVERDLRAQGERPLSVVGRDTTPWVLLDYGDVVVHLFSAAAREYYGLENIRADASDVDWAESA